MKNIVKLPAIVLEGLHFNMFLGASWPKEANAKFFQLMGSFR